MCVFVPELSILFHHSNCSAQIVHCLDYHSFDIKKSSYLGEFLASSTTTLYLDFFFQTILSIIGLSLLHRCLRVSLSKPYWDFDLELID